MLILSWFGRITRNKDVVAIASLLVISLMLWLPGGFRMVGLVEEWRLGHLAADGFDTLVRGTVGFADTQYTLRPFHAMPWGVSALIPPNVIVGQNVMLCLLFFGKAAALYGVIAEVLPAQRRLAFLTSVLFVIFPSDTGLYGLRNLAIHASTFLFFLSIYLLLVFARTSHWGWLSASLIANAAGLLTYESAFLLTLVAPFLLVIKSGWNRATIAVVGIYLLVPIVLAVRYIFLMGELQGPYQAYLLNIGMPGGLGASIPDMAASVINALARNAWTGWVEAVAAVGQHADLLWAAAIITAVSLACAWWLRGSEDSDQHISARHLVILFGLGIAVFLLGFAPYLPTPIRSEYERVFILSSAGAALSVLAVCWLVVRLIPQRAVRATALLIVACALIGLAAAKALGQHQEYIAYSNDQQRFLASVLDIAPRIEPDTCIVVMDVPYSQPFFFYGRVFHEAFQYLFDDYTLKGLFCDSGGPLACEAELEAGGINRLDGIWLTCRREQLLVLDYTPLYSGGYRARLLDDLPARLALVIGGPYDPYARIGSAPPRAALLDAVFGNGPPAAETGTPLESLRLDFDEAILGRGWRFPEVNDQGLTWVWTVAPEATIAIGLMSEGDYRLTGHVLWGAEPSILETVGVAFNGHIVDLTIDVQPDGTVMISGDIPREWVTRDDSNVLSVTSDHLMRASDDDPYELGVAVDWLEITLK